MDKEFVKKLNTVTEWVKQNDKSEQSVVLVMVNASKRELTFLA